MKRHFKYFILTTLAATFISCGTGEQNKTTGNHTNVIQLVDTLSPDTVVAAKPDLNRQYKDTIILTQTFEEEDLEANDYLKEKLKPIRENFKSINSIKEWTGVDKRKLEKIPNNGVAEYYYLNKNIEKIIVHYPTYSSSDITEYYLLNRQLSFVLEKSINTTGDSHSEIITAKSYFINNKLLHQINNQDCGSPFTDEYLLGEQKRIMDNFKNIIARLNK